MTYRIYMITGPNGKRYIGKTNKKNVRARWLEHVGSALRRKSPHALHAAIRKYGAAAFTIRVLTECVDDREANACERGLIAAHGTWANSRGGYNMTTGGEPGGEHLKGRKQPAELLNRLSAIRTGRKFTPEWSAKLAAALHSPETVAKWRAWDDERKRLTVLAKATAPRVFTRTPMRSRSYIAPPRKRFRRSAQSIVKQRATIMSDSKREATLAKLAKGRQTTIRKAQAAAREQCRLRTLAKATAPRIFVQARIRPLRDHGLRAGSV